MKSTRIYNAENERVKRAYLTYLRLAKGYAIVSVDKVAAALLRFENAIGMKPFRNISIEKHFPRRAECENQGLEVLHDLVPAHRPDLS